MKEIQNEDNKLINKECLEIIPIGGLEEIGKNSTLISYKKNAVLVDFGAIFPKSRNYGIDLIVSDISNIIKKGYKIQALLITHGHEDHIGGIAYLLRYIKLSIYATPFTIGLLKNKLSSKNLSGNIKFHEVKFGSPFRVSGFTVKMIRSTHSIIDSALLLINTPLGRVIHTGDFKIDANPLDKNYFDLKSLYKLNKEDNLLMLSDSTNILNKGRNISETEVYKSLLKTISAAKSRVLISSFASNLQRVYTIFKIAIQLNKRVCILGKSLLNNVELANKFKYFGDISSRIVAPDKLLSIPDSRTIIIMTGTQAEVNSAMNVMSLNEHRIVKLNKKDSVIISGSAIPNNKVDIFDMINRILKIGASVFYEGNTTVHTSGHGYRDELSQLIDIIKPRYFIPVHGEYMHLKEHAKVAEDTGINIKNIKIISNGDIVQVSKNYFKKISKINIPIFNIQNNTPLEDSFSILKDRKTMGYAGIVLIYFWIISYDDENISFDYDIITKGFLSESILNKKITQPILKAIGPFSQYNTKEFLGNRSLKSKFVQHIFKNLSYFIYKKFQRNPLLVVNLK